MQCARSYCHHIYLVDLCSTSYHMSDWALTTGFSSLLALMSSTPLLTVLADRFWNITLLQVDTTSVNADAILASVGNSAAVGGDAFAIASAPEEDLVLQGSLMVIGPVVSCPVSTRDMGIMLCSFQCPSRFMVCAIWCPSQFWSHIFQVIWIGVSFFIHCHLQMRATAFVSRVQLGRLMYLTVQASALTTRPFCLFVAGCLCSRLHYCRCHTLDKQRLWHFQPAVAFSWPLQFWQY